MKNLEKLQGEISSIKSRLLMLRPDLDPEVVLEQTQKIYTETWGKTFTDVLRDLEKLAQRGEPMPWEAH